MGPQIIVLFKFFSVEEGGRQDVWYLNNYRPHLRVIGDTEYLGVAFLEDATPISSNDWTLGIANLMYYPNVSYKQLNNGTEFQIIEGKNVVGIGTVVECLR